MRLKKKPVRYRNKKKPRVITEIEKNHRICRHVYQSMFVEVIVTFIQYINMLTPDEIQQLDNDLKDNGWRVK